MGSMAFNAVLMAPCRGEGEYAFRVCACDFTRLLTSLIILLLLFTSNSKFIGEFKVLFRVTMLQVSPEFPEIWLLSGLFPCDLPIDRSIHFYM